MIESLIKSDQAELIRHTKKAIPVVLSTRIRLARNLIESPFPERATSAQRKAVLAKCEENISVLQRMKKGVFLDVEELSNLERQVLLERHLISRELCEGGSGTGVFVNKAQNCSVMINEEDHLRIQFLKSGFNLKSVWKQINAFDIELERLLDVAYNEDLGYLTACPTNLGTGLRASVMMHLPGLVIADHMERVVRTSEPVGNCRAWPFRRRFGCDRTCVPDIKPADPW